MLDDLAKMFRFHFSDWEKIFKLNKLLKIFSSLDHSFRYSFPVDYLL